MSPLLRRLTWWLRGSRKEAELREELEFHLAQEAEERRHQGARDDEARFAAKRDLGNEIRVREDVRAIWAWRPLDELQQDTRYALRTMMRHRAVTIFAILSLALGIGANTAIYSFMHAVLLKTLPVSDPDSLVVVMWQAKNYNNRRADRQSEFVMHSTDGSTFERVTGGIEARIIPFAAFERLKEASEPVLSSLFAVFRGGKLNVRIDGAADVADVRYVSGEFFPALAVNPGAGRLLTPDDDRTGAVPTAVMTAGFAERRFGSIDAAVGRAVMINNVSFTIVGVTAANFEDVEPGLPVSLYVPLRLNVLVERNATVRYNDQTYYWLEVMGRLRPGVTAVQAQSALAPAFEQWARSTAVNDLERANLPVLEIVDGATGLDTLRRRYAQPLYLLQAIVGFILAIACANTANLLLARASARQREMAVRLSIGAGRFRLMRQLLTESVILSLISGSLGALLAVAGTRVLSALLANANSAVLLQASVNWRVLLVTVGLSMACGILFGLAPAVQTTRTDLVPALKDSGSASSTATVRHRLLRLKLQHGLVVAQITLLALLLVGAGLFTQTLAKLQSVPLGFNPHNVLLFDINAAQAGYPEASAPALYEDLRGRLAQIPGVRSVTMSHASMITAGRSHPVLIDGKRIEGNYRIMQAGPAYLSTMQIRLVSGRDIDARDLTRPVGVAIVSELFARTYFAGQNPIGRHITVAPSGAMEAEIVGVAASARYGGIKRDEPPVLYVSYAQVRPVTTISKMTFAMRTDKDPLQPIATVRRIVSEADPRIAVANIKTQSAEIDSTINQEIILARICDAFAGVALVIAGVGLYGTLAYAVSRRTKEIGVRIAIGARRSTVVWMVLREVCLLISLGLAISVPIARSLAKFVESFLFQLKPADPRAIAGAIALLAIAAAIAAYGPARRASRIDPVTALRYE
jgi:macrolide transport system ATP-binding/permease protein